MGRKELAFTNIETALKVTELLLAECYVVMLSREEEFYILNYEYSEHCDRNNVVFMSREDYDENIHESYSQGEEDSVRCFERK